LKLFGQSIKQARRAYESFVAKGADQGRRPDLIGGGLLRSVGGWSELKEFRDIGVRIKVTLWSVSGNRHSNHDGRKR
jgi:REP-associated tyrosine transposase